MASSFGGTLRRLRTDAGMSLTDLANRVYYSKGHLSKIESGHRGPTEDLARLCDSVFEAGGSLLGLARGTTASSDAGISVAVDSVTVGELIAMITDLSRETQPGSPEDDEVRAQALRIAFAHLRSLGQQLDPGRVLTLFAHQVRPLLAMAGTAGPERDRFAARCAEFAGWMAQEKGDNAGALRLTDAAMTLAARAEDRDLVAHTWVRRAEVALYQRDAGAVLESSVRAQLDRLVSPRVRALGACVEAHGHALKGDARGCDGALSRAEDLFGQYRDAVDGFTIGSSTVDDLVSVTAGWCDVELGRHAAAVEKLEPAVRRLPTNSRRARGLFSARVCAAYAAMGEGDLACEFGREPLDHVRYTRSAGALSQLRIVRRSLRRWGHRDVVRDFNADLTDVLYDSARARVR